MTGPVSSPAKTGGKAWRDEGATYIFLGSGGRSLFYGVCCILKTETKSWQACYSSSSKSGFKERIIARRCHDSKVVLSLPGPKLNVIKHKFTSYQTKTAQSSQLSHIPFFWVARGRNKMQPAGPEAGSKGRIRVRFLQGSFSQS